jgi:hypothetical protein
MAIFSRHARGPAIHRSLAGESGNLLKSAHSQVHYALWFAFICMEYDGIHGIHDAYDRNL